MANIIKTITARLTMDTTELQKNIKDTNARLAATRTELNALQKSLEFKWDEAKWKRSQELAKQEVEETRKKLEQLKQLQAQYDAEGLDNTTEEYAQLRAEIVKINEKLEIAERRTEAINRQKLDHIRAEWDKVGDSMIRFGKQLSLVSAAVTAAGGLAAKSAIEYESAFAGVRKTVDATEEELAKLSDGIRELSKEIPVSAASIAQIAENAGQLGIQTENILNFSKTMADLGVATNLAGEEAAQMFAKFANITGMSQQDFDELGSAIVELGNNLATTEADIANMSLRLAAAGTQAGMSEADILGLSGALSSVGLEAEAGGSAFSKAINKINVAVQTGNEDLKEFAAIAGMSADEFKKAFERDSADAIISFVKGLGDMETHGKSATAILEELGLTEVRLRDALVRAAGASDLFRESLEMANTAWAENEALTKEAAQRYETTASQIELAKNAINDAATTLGEELLPVIVKATGWVRDITESFSDMDAEQKNNIIRLGAFAAAIGPVVLGIGGLIKAINLARNAIMSLQAGTMALNPTLLIVSGALAVFTSLLASDLVGSAAEADTELQKLTKTLDGMKKSYEDSIASIEKSAAAERDKISSVQELIKHLEEINGATEEAALLANEINGLFGEQVYILDEQAGKYVAAKGSVDDYIASLETAIERELKFEELRAEMARRQDLQKAIEEANNALEENKKKLEEAAQSTAMFNSESYELGVEQLKIIEQIEILNEEMGGLDEVIEKLKNEYSGAGDAVSAAAKGTERLAVSAVDTDKIIKDLAKSIGELPDEFALLEKAIDEQNNAASLNYDTILDLIDAGYAYALVLDEETGAVRLDADSYYDLAAAKIAEQRATMAIELRNAQARALEVEEERAFALRAGLTELADARIKDAVAAHAQVKGLESSIAIYDELLKRFQSGGFSSGAKQTSSSSSGSGGSTRKKTQEELELERELEKYKEAKAELDHLREMDELSAAEYYERLEAQRDEHLQSDSNEWRSATEQINKYRAEQMNLALEAVRNGYADILEAAEYYGVELETLTAKHDFAVNYEKQMEKALKAVTDGNKSIYEAAKEFNVSLEELAELHADYEKNIYSRRVADIKYQLDMGIIEHQQYYDELMRLMRLYLVEGSDEWRRGMVEIYNWTTSEQKRVLDEQQAAYEKALKEREAAIKSYTEARKAQIKEELELEEKRLNTIIEGIQAEIDARRQLRQDESAEDKIGEARKRVAEAEKALAAAKAQELYARDDAARAEAQKEVLRREAAVEDAKKAVEKAIQDFEDIQFYREKEAAISDVKDLIAAAREKADTELDQAELYATERYNQEQAELRALQRAAENAERNAQASERSADAAEVAMKSMTALAGAVTAATSSIVNNVTNITKSAVANVTYTSAAATTGQLTSAINRVLEAL